MNTSTISGDDISKALRETISRAGAIAKDPLADGPTRTLAAAVSLLALIIDAQQQRIVALSTCPKTNGHPHEWAGPDVPVCIRCQVRR